MISNLASIAAEASAKLEENHQFSQFIKQQPEAETDRLLHQINESVSATIDCTECGNCCRSLMINVTGEEVDQLSAGMQISSHTFKEKYIEQSSEGQLIINQIPCHFLEGNRCSIYENRFTECRLFPHLHKPHFKDRVSSTLMYYGTCPIIYNCMEILKLKTGFKK